MLCYFLRKHFIFIFFIHVFFVSCEQSHPLKNPVELQDLVFGEELDISVKRLEKKSWVTETIEDNKITLTYTKDKNQKDLELLNSLLSSAPPSIKKNQEAIKNLNSPIQLVLYADSKIVDNHLYKAKAFKSNKKEHNHKRLILARIIQNSSAPEIKKYKERLRKLYHFQKPSWVSPSSSSSAEEYPKRVIEIYENECCFIALHQVINKQGAHIVVSTKDKRVLEVPSLQDSLEVFYYSKLNPGLNIDTLVESLKKDI